MAGICRAKQRRGSRHKAKYDAYRNSQTREINKAKKIAKHLWLRPNDNTAITAIKKLPLLVLKRAKVGAVLDSIGVKL